ncbi:MAG: CoA transferase [Deltaproteobacteria bacterium]|nr:CoA transferase [Deltaproteobacteria bacterium]
MKDNECQEDQRPMPLEGIRIIEFAGFHAGPGATAILGDLGADIIKIEEPAGDPMRTWSDVGGMSFVAPNGEGLLFHFTNRNKKSLCLDIHQEEGRKIFHRLLEGADVFLTSMRRTTRTAMGIDYAAISRVNPRIIYASVSGFGPEGALNDHGAFDPMGQARSGMMFISGGEEPELLHLAILDQSTSIGLSHAILTALFDRERRGVGQEVHISLYSTALWVQYVNLLMAGCIDLEPIPGDRRHFSPLRNFFRCKDGKWVIGTHHPEEKYWGRLLDAIGRRDLLQDPRFRDVPSMKKNVTEVVDLFDSIFATRTRDEWLPILRENGLMFGPVQRIKDVLDDPQALANQYVEDFVHPSLGPVRIPGYPIHFSAASAGMRSAAPAVGEHTSSVMKGLGYSDDEIRGLKERKVLGEK